MNAPKKPLMTQARQCFLTSLDIPRLAPDQHRAEVPGIVARVDQHAVEPQHIRDREHEQRQRRERRSLPSRTGTARPSTSARGSRRSRSAPRSPTARRAWSPRYRASAPAGAGSPSRCRSSDCGAPCRPAPTKRPSTSPVRSHREQRAVGPVSRARGPGRSNAAEIAGQLRQAGCSPPARRGRSGRPRAKRRSREGLPLGGIARSSRPALTRKG